jgi:hypothetical protein
MKRRAETMKWSNGRRWIGIASVWGLMGWAACAAICYMVNPPSLQQCGDVNVSGYYYCNGERKDTYCTAPEYFVEVIQAPGDGQGRTTGYPCECYCTMSCNGQTTYNECCTTSGTVTVLNGEPCYGG